MEICEHTRFTGGGGDLRFPFHSRKRANARTGFTSGARAERGNIGNRVDTEIGKTQFARFDKGVTRSTGNLSSTHTARIRFRRALVKRARHSACPPPSSWRRGVAFLHCRCNLICAAVRAERAAHRLYRHVKRKHMQIRYFPTI